MAVVLEYTLKYKTLFNKLESVVHKPTSTKDVLELLEINEFMDGDEIRKQLKQMFIIGEFRYKEE